MTRYRPEPAHTHGAVRKTAVLLANLGTPQAPTAPALRRYLGQFLWDPRVVEIPRPLWWLILHGIILRLRPKQSARKYALIWTAEGSPLKLHTERQAKLLAGALGEIGHRDIVVAWAMRYGEPAIAAVLDRLKAEGASRILILPLYPQYAASASASVYDAVADWLKRSRNIPELRFLRSFHDDPGYIAALAASVEEYWAKHGRPDKLVMSFHGLPRYTLDRGDPYHCECQKTARLLAEALGLAEHQWQLTFQSRFGRTEWLQPYTQPTLEALGRSGIGRVDVICPGFVGDCLETLEEIAIEARAAFLQAGGREFHYLPCVNERDDWIAALAGLARAHLGNWLALPATDPGAAERAKALGAKR
ncbi:ferrochelatase [mine drainage metagenome]|uniref:Ferrochelatase n=1 Tax=mine drainage metagenome TaxID=410659 RepID=A0A1J5RK61_9ZZZZ